VLRHGSRYPSANQIEKSKKFLNQVKSYRDSKLNNNDTSRNKQNNVIDDIEHSFTADQHYRLSTLGGDEMQSIAKRYAARYPSLFTNLNENDLNILTSSKERSVHSAHYFLKGLFHETTDKKKLEHLINNKVLVDDRMMRLFDECETYLYHVKRNKSALNELKLFGETVEFKDLIQKFKKRHDIDELNVEPSKIF
jgi:hypothetical protein